MYSSNITEHSDEARFFNDFIKTENIELNKINKFSENVPQSMLFFYKNDLSIYMGHNKRNADLQGFKSLEEVYGLSDFTMPHIDHQVTPEELQKEDRACMDGKDIKLPKFIILGEDNDINLFQRKKIPIVSKQKTVGVLVVAIDITQAFLNLKEVIASENIPLPKVSVHGKLSPRELTALRLYNQGLPRKIAAKQLNISESTYAWYLREIRLKFNITTRAEMLMLEQHFN